MSVQGCLHRCFPFLSLETPISGSLCADMSRGADPTAAHPPKQADTERNKKWPFCDGLNCLISGYHGPLPLLLPSPKLASLASEKYICPPAESEEFWDDGTAFGHINVILLPRPLPSNNRRKLFQGAC